MENYIMTDDENIPKNILEGIPKEILCSLYFFLRKSDEDIEFCLLHGENHGVYDRNPSFTPEGMKFLGCRMLDNKVYPIFRKI